MGVSKLPVDFKPERWELIFYVVRRRLSLYDHTFGIERLMPLLAGWRYMPLGLCDLDSAP